MTPADDKTVSAKSDTLGMVVFVRPNARGKPHRSAKHGGNQQAKLVGGRLPDFCGQLVALGPWIRTLQGEGTAGKNADAVDCRSGSSFAGIP